MKLTTTRIYDANGEAWLGSARRSLNEGGTASSKTWSILQILIGIAAAARTSLLISVVSESLPHLRRGAIRDFFRILEESQENNPRYNKTMHTYTFGKGAIEFFGADEADKVRGPRRHILFLNEANNIPWDAARGLDIRTSMFTFVDWNPVSEFWVHQYEDAQGKMIPGWMKEANSAYVHSTYLDALGLLPEAVVENIESNRYKDVNWWNVYGLGLLGKIEGLVYPLFEQVDELPRQGLTVYGLDFGFSGDPAVLVKNKIFAEEVYSEELFFERGLTNQDIAGRMDELGIERRTAVIWADSAEPKSIEEIYRLGFNINGVPKGPGSVEYGHQKVRQYRQYWTKGSTNCIKEQRNFRYLADKNGKLTERTTHMYSHGMDARRYGIMGAWEPVATEDTVEFDAMTLVGTMDLR